MHSLMGDQRPEKGRNMSDPRDEVVPVAFTLPQAAAALGIPLRDVKRLVEDGMLGSIGVGIRRIVPLIELQRFMRENLVRRG